MEGGMPKEPGSPSQKTAKLLPFVGKDRTGEPEHEAPMSWADIVEGITARLPDLREELDEMEFLRSWILETALKNCGDELLKLIVSNMRYNTQLSMHVVNIALRVEAKRIKLQKHP